MVDGRANAEIEDADKIPDKFVEIVTTRKIDKAAVTKALKAGESVSGAVLTTTKAAIKIS